MWGSFLQKQAVTGSPQNSCSKEFFGKMPGRPVCILKKNSTLDVLLGRMQKFSFRAVIFSKYQWTDASESLNSLFPEHQWTAFVVKWY